MKTKTIFALASVLFLLLLNACKEDREIRTKNEEIIIEGSNTEFDLVNKLVLEFQAAHNDQVKMSVKGGGSNEGMNKFLEGKIDILNSSRLINDEEVSTAVSNGITATQAIIAMDAVAIITNPKLGIDSLSLSDLRAIFSGELTNWKELDGPDLPIHIYNRDKSSGTHSYIRRKMVGEKELASYREVASPDQLMQLVKGDLAGIAYIGVGSLFDKEGRPDGSIWAMNLYIDGGKAFSPYELVAVKSGDYPLTRPLLQYFKKFPEGEILDFLKFTLSEKGQEVVRKSGYFAVTDFQKQINKENGIVF